MAVASFWLLDHAPIMGGAELLALRLAGYAVEARGLQASIVCPADSPLAGRARDLEIATLEASFPGFEPWRAPAQLLAVRRLRQLLRTIGDDGVVVTVSARAQAYTIAAARSLSRAPAVVHLALEQDTARRLSARLALPRYGALLALGANTAKAYRKALGSMPVGQLNNFLTPQEMAELREGRVPRQASGTLGVLARMIPDKGILELVDELAGDITGWNTLLVAGSPESPDYEQAVRARVHALGLDSRIQLLGQLPESRTLLHRADVLVVPSTGSEGQPTVILEALASGLPVVVRRPVYSEDYHDLPVFPYSGAAELSSALAQARRAEIPSVEKLLERFGPDQALDAIQRTAAG